MSDRTVAWRSSVKMVYLEISQNLQEKTCARVSFSMKLQARVKDNLAQMFSCDFCEFLRISFSTKHLRWLLLERNQRKLKLNVITWVMRIINHFLHCTFLIASNLSKTYIQLQITVIMTFRLYLLKSKNILPLNVSAALIQKPVN